MENFDEDKMKFLQFILERSKETMLQFATEEDKKAINLIFSEEFFLKLLPPNQQNFISDSRRNFTQSKKQEISAIKQELQAAKTQRQKDEIIKKFDKIKQELTEDSENRIKKLGLEAKTSFAELSKKEEVKELKKAIPVFKELRDRMSIDDHKVVAIAPLFDEFIKTVTNQVEFRELEEKEADKKVTKPKTKEIKIIPLPQLFKDPKNLEKNLEILMREENRYIIKGENGEYVWRKKKIQLVAFALYCLNKNCLNESMQNFSTKVRESFCKFFNKEIDISMFQGKNLDDSEKYLSDFQLLLK
ncbi:MAG: hypothetical protein EAZ08_04295 [Cytophagales bacterium]|nr:MAG: hypothetical protein EAZ08_04295 [Cytophagales bacterium]